MKVFITGATGFVGSYTAKRMVDAGHEIYCLVRKTSKVDDLKKLGAKLVYGDVTDKASIVEGMKGCDWVINLANLYVLWAIDRSLYTKVNIDGTRNVMEAAVETKVSKVLHVSTAGVYGHTTDCPFNEKSPMDPNFTVEYDRTKYEGEMIAWDFYREKKLPLVVINPGSILGAGDDKASGEYIEDFLEQDLPGEVFPKSVITFVYVKDVAEAIVRALEKKDNIGEKYLVGGAPTAMGELNQMLSEISGVPKPRKEFSDTYAAIAAAVLTAEAQYKKKKPDMQRDMAVVIREGFNFDGSKAERELGIKYTPIRIALEEAIAAYRLRKA